MHYLVLKIIFLVYAMIAVTNFCEGGTQGCKEVTGLSNPDGINKKNVWYNNCEK